MFDELERILMELQKELKLVKERLDELEGKGDIEILSTADISKILGININSAGEYFKKPDFPKIPYCKTNKVEKQAFLRYIRCEEACKNNQNSID